MKRRRWYPFMLPSFLKFSFIDWEDLRHSLDLFFVLYFKLSIPRSSAVMEIERYFPATLLCVFSYFKALFVFFNFSNQLVSSMYTVFRNALISMHPNDRAQLHFHLSGCVKASNSTINISLMNVLTHHPRILCENTLLAKTRP